MGSIIIHLKMECDFFVTPILPEFVGVYKLWKDMKEQKNRNEWRIKKETINSLR